MRHAIRLVLVLLPLLLTRTEAQALIYDSDSVGNDVAGPWEYDTFSGTPNAKFTIGGVIDVALPLAVGTNTFAVSGGSVSSNFGFGLYFSSTATPFAGPFSAVPNLVVVDAPGPGSTFGFATNGAQVSTYGQYSAVVPYSGVTNYVLGGYAVTVTAFDYFSGSASLQLTVTSVPEPSTCVSLGSGFLLIGLVQFRRRRA
ncbi:MAG: PEP-CTERM sorting domain-containing protein [Opitutaceae bacterium]|nr:PEP-CTERM sorting domain-containing protein [Opitutaceae bacterium]